MHDVQSSGDPAWVHGHAHEPNPTPPPGDGSLAVVTPDGQLVRWSVAELVALPCTCVDNCMIVSTGHDPSGPFTFGGVRLVDLLAAALPAATSWRSVDVVSQDGFGVRLTATELTDAPTDAPLFARLSAGQCAADAVTGSRAAHRAGRDRRCPPPGEMGGAIEVRRRRACA